MPRPSWITEPSTSTLDITTRVNYVCASSRAKRISGVTDYMRTSAQSFVRISTDATSLTCAIYTTETAASAALAAYAPSTGTWTSTTASSQNASSISLSLPGTGTREVWIFNQYERLSSTPLSLWLRSATPDDGSAFTVLPYTAGRQQIISAGWGSGGLVSYASGEIVEEAKRAYGASGVAASAFKILIQVGRNDAAAQIAASTHGTRLSGVIDALVAVNTDWKIYCLTPIPQTTETWGAVTLTQYRTEIASVVTGKSDANVTTIDGTAVMTTGDLFDGVHPDDDGHTAYAGQIRTALGLSTGSGCTLLLHDSQMVQTQTLPSQSKNTISKLLLGDWT
jgi:hypothetical protein